MLGRFLTSNAPLFACFVARTRSRDLVRGFSAKIRVGELLEQWQMSFKDHSISEPRESIENILMHVLKTRKFSDVYKLKNRVLSLRELREVDRLAHLRMNRMPVQYILGEWDFRDLKLAMRPPVFIPRPETEQLVDLAMQGLRPNALNNVLEVCCGCGAISLALLKADKELHAVAVDISQDACELTKENAEMNGLLDRIHVINADISKSDSLVAILEDRKFHVIVGNPPYIPSGDLEDLQPEIALYEDKAALDGGEDGLKLIREVLKIAEQLLLPGGRLFLETDYRHPPILENILKNDEKTELEFIGGHDDVYDRLRFVEIAKKAKKT